MAQCDLVTRLSQRLLPNALVKFYQIGFFYETHANSSYILMLVHIPSPSLEFSLT